MDIAFRDKFLALWSKHFGPADLPLVAYYTDAPAAPEPPAAKGWSCLVAQLARVRRGESVCLSRESVGCMGGKRYLGFTAEIMENFEHFLSGGIPGKLPGERYKKSPEIVRQAMANIPPMDAPAKYVVLKRWDKLDAADEPAIVIFLATPDVLAGLYTLAGYDETEREAVIAPFGAGCATIVQYPYQEADRPRPRAVLGMLDPSARPFVPPGVVSFAAPMSMFTRMVENMDESFLITDTWQRVRKRIEAAQ